MQDYNWIVGSKNIGGIISEKEALIQWIQRVLLTERNTYPIYSSNYGIEYQHLKGKRWDYVGINLRETIRDALQQHPDIINIQNYSFEKISTIENALSIQFEVQTRYGVFSIQQKWDF